MGRWIVVEGGATAILLGVPRLEFASSLALSHPGDRIIPGEDETDLSGT